MTNNQDGSYTVTLTDNTVETTTLSVTEDNVTFTKDVTFRNGEVDENATTVTANLDSIVVNDTYEIDDPLIITVHAVDVETNPMTEVSVNLESNGSNTTISAVNNSDKNNGNYTFKVYSTKAERVEFNASVNGKAIVKKVEVLFTHGEVDASESNLTAGPSELDSYSIAADSTSYLNITLRDRFRNLITDVDPNAIEAINETNTGELIFSNRERLGDTYFIDGFGHRTAEEINVSVEVTLEDESKIKLDKTVDINFTDPTVSGIYSKNTFQDECGDYVGVAKTYTMILKFRDNNNTIINLENGINDITLTGQCVADDCSEDDIVTVTNLRPIDSSSPYAGSYEYQYEFSVNFASKLFTLDARIKNYEGTNKIVIDRSLNHDYTCSNN